jgi:von Willebrand factor type A domain
MGRHADRTAPRRRARPGGVSPTLPIIAAVAAVVLLAGGITWWAVGSGAGGCDETDVVRVAVAPTMAPVAEQVLAGAEGLGEDDCARAEVTEQEPVQVVGRLGTLEPAALPHVWVPDSSLRVAQAQDPSLQVAGSVATSPVVLGTSAAAAEAQGWTDSPPGWGEVLASGQPLAVPDLSSSTEGLTAVGAVRVALGADEDADNAVVQALLAAGRAGPVDVGSIGAAGTEAPVVPMTEQQVIALNQGGDEASVVAVYPSEGSPELDYPVVRVGTEGTSAAAVDAVVTALTSGAARDAALAAGFRDAEGTAPGDVGEATGTREQAPEVLELDPAAVQALLERVASLVAPSRILAVFDISTSMEAPAGDGSRATLARDAAKSTLSLVPGNFALGLWFFAAELQGDRDWQEVVPTRELDAPAAGGTQRDALDAQLDTIPERLSPGGTGLYDTTLDAVRAARADFDPTAVNSVLLVTDGANDDDGLDLAELLETLESEADPQRPVQVIGVALGPDADLDALEQIAEATEGAAYSAVDPADLQTVLFDALRQRE